MITNEGIARVLISVTDVFNNAMAPDGKRPLWFVSFGSLLWFIRDKVMGRPFNQDIDISVIYGEYSREYLIQKFTDCGLKLEKEVLDNYSQKPLQMGFRPDGSSQMADVSVDVFFWVLGKEYAWHTYDMTGQNRTILPEYTFKGTPKDYLLAPTIEYVWEEIAPSLNFPTRYGSLLDVWYPPTKGPDGKYVANTGWLYPNRQFGQSEAYKVKTIKSCQDMEAQLG